jgi:hypothetical protein
MKIADNSHKLAIQAIDRLMDQEIDLLEMLEWDLASGRLKDSRLKSATELLSKIYMIAHAENESHSCHHVHVKWRKIKDEVMATTFVDNTERKYEKNKTT